MLVYYSAEYAYFAKELAEKFNFSLGEFERKQFPDGELYHRILNRVAGEEVVLVGGTGNDTATLELFDLACGLAAAGASSLKLVVPYFGYATMERAVKMGEIVKAKTRAQLFSAIPPGDGNNEIILLDLHSEGIPYYFSHGLLATHLYARPVILAAAQELGGSDFVLGSTDAGRAKWVQSLAQDLKVEPAFVYKKRESATQTSVTGINANVKNRVVVLYDDMIRTGGSLLKAAAAYRAAGATDVCAVATHILMPNDTRDAIEKTQLISKIIGTNSTPQANHLENHFLQIKSVCAVFGDYLTQRLQW